MTTPLIEVLQYLVPDCKCLVWEDNYDKIVWNDDRPIPTKAEVEAAIPTVKAAAQVRLAKKDAQNKIDALEAKQHRALREFSLGIEGSKERLQAIDDKIKTYRAVISQ